MELENVKEVIIPENIQWCIDVKQPNSDEVRKGVFVSEEETFQVTGSRGSAHFLLKWPGGKKESQMDIIRIKKGVLRNITDADSDEYVPIVAFECRGIEPFAYYPQSGFTVSSGSALFEDVDLNDDWAEYDEEGEQAVSIQNLEYKFTVVKA